jgi:hypothetical protein
MGLFICFIATLLYFFKGKMSRSSKSKSKQKRKQQHNKLSDATIIQSGDSARALATTTTPTAPINYQGNDDNPPPLHPGRQSLATNANPLSMLSYAFLPRRQFQDIDLIDMSRWGQSYNPQQLIEMLMDLSPHVSRAVSNKTLMTNRGWYFQVKSLDGRTDLKRAKARLDALIERINKDSGGLDAIIDSLCISVISQGAACAEIALTDDLEDIDDIYTIQPWTIWFERDSTQRLVPFQEQINIGYGGSRGGNGYGVYGFPYKRLNPTTFSYIPYQSPPDDAYGRSPIASVLQEIAFDLQMKKDIRAWAHTSAWGRMDVKIIEEKVIATAPTFQNDPTGQQKRNWVDKKIAALAAAYNRIQADDAIIHGDSIEVDSVDTSGKTFQIDGLLKAIDRRMFMALQELPVLMGSNEGTTETHGTIQLEVYANHIESFQKIISNTFAKLFSVALQVWGIAGKVLWFFEPVRANDRLKDAQADMIESQAEAYKRDQGWKTQDEVSIEITGHEAVADAPKQQMQIAAPQIVTEPTDGEGKEADTKTPEPKADPIDENGQTEEDKKAA